MNQQPNTATMTGAACLDLLSIARGWPQAEWHDTPAAELWAYTPSEFHGLDGTACEKVGTAGDIYRLLDDAARTLDGVADLAGLAFVTWGWAAPIDAATGEPDGAPSQHPERRRVRLASVITAAGVTSRIVFRDDEQNHIDDEGEARGPLAEALADLWETLTA